jgi:hypothetical protein
MSLPPVQGSSFPRTISTLASATRSTIEAEIVYDDLLALERAHAKRLHSVRTLHSRRAIIGRTKNRRGSIGGIGGGQGGGAGSDNNIANQADSDLEDNEGGNAMEEDEQGVSEEEEELEEEEREEEEEEE